MRKLFVLLILGLIFGAWWSGVFVVKNTGSSTIVTIDNEKAKAYGQKVADTGREIAGKAVEKGKELMEAPATGGSVSGVVVYDGVAPPARMIPVRAYEQNGPDVKEVLDETLIVDKETNALKWAVVRVMIQPKDAVPNVEKLVEISQKNLTYTPHVVVVAPGQKVKMLSPDGVAHNPHLDAPQVPEYGWSQPRKGDDASQFLEDRYFKETGLIKLQCDVHSWMKGLIVVHDPRYCAVTGADGKFEIKNIPPGQYQLSVYQERCSGVGQTIDIKAGGVVDAGSIKMKKGKK